MTKKEVYLQTLYSQTPTVYHKQITKTVFYVPSWYFQLVKCDVCKQNVRRLITHGYHNETCTVIELNDYETMPLHDECYKEKFEKDNPIEAI